MGFLISGVLTNYHIKKILQNSRKSSPQLVLKCNEIFIHLKYYNF